MNKAPTSSSAICQLDRLAAVEFQLCMHPLSLADRLRLARCCRDTLALASHPFAWKHAPLLDVHINCSRTNIAPRLNAGGGGGDDLSSGSYGGDNRVSGSAKGHRLLRHVSTRVVWSHPHQWEDLEQPAPGEAEVAAVLAVPRMCALDGSERRVAQAVWTRVLTHPALQALQSLHIGECSSVSALTHLELDATGTLMRTISQLTHLHTLTMDLLLTRRAWTDPGYHWLAALPKLTSLTLTDGSDSPAHSIMPIAESCRQLQRLHVSKLNLPLADFRRFFQSAGMSQLRHLTLQRCHLTDATPFTGATAAARSHTDVEPPLSSLDGETECACSGSALSRLHSLDLLEVTGVDSLLPHLTHPSSQLHALLIQPSCMRGDSSWPTECILQQLLTLAPQLQVQLRLPADLRSSLSAHAAEAALLQLAQSADQVAP